MAVKAPSKHHVFVRSFKRGTQSGHYSTDEPYLANLTRCPCPICSINPAKNNKISSKFIF